MSHETASVVEPAEFSLVHGGPLFRALRRAHVCGDAMEQLWRRILVVVAVAWLPLLVLSAWEGDALGGKAKIPFLLDFEVHVRLLVALPLLFAAEVLVHVLFREIRRQFVGGGLVAGEATAKFDAAVAWASRVRDSVVAEIAILALVLTVGVPVLWRGGIALHARTWYATPTEQGGLSFTPTGVWFAWVSVALFQFMLLRWYFRIAIWAGFLWRVSRIELHLVPTHPDRAGGLGFISNTPYALGAFLAAHGAVLAASYANRIFYMGEALYGFRWEILGWVVALPVIATCPLLVFAWRLAAARRRGMREYGALAHRYVAAFEAKWLRGGASPDEQLVGSADIQSLSDLAGSYEIVRSMRWVPISRDALVRLGLAVAAPISPLLLTMISFEDLLKRALGKLF
jgi:hypothetical protein